MKKKLEELNLLDDFLFGTLISHPVYGERFARVRFYRSTIDTRNLQSGADYSQLKNVIIIMVLPYDPFGCDRIIYTVKNQCLEEPTLIYDDGALNLFLYVKGKKGAISQKLKELLHYMENTTRNNAVNDSLQELHSMVNQIKHNKEVSISYMKLYERERMMRREALVDPIKDILSDLGPIPEEITTKIDSERDPSTLRHWLKLAAKANSLEEFAEEIS